jgi:hypothetical protein
MTKRQPPSPPPSVSKQALLGADECFQKAEGWLSCELVEHSRRARVLQRRDVAAAPLSLKGRIRGNKAPTSFA